MTQEPKDNEIDASGSYSTYLEYNKVLRTWFVAFGVGGPALLFANDSIAKRLAVVGNLRCIAILFLVGVGAQVMGALINKIANWYVYSKYEQLNIVPSKLHDLAEHLAGQFWIDIFFDLLTVGTFGIAAWTLLNSLTAP